MRIAVDAMGGDHAPREIVRGAVEASREWPELEIVLLGDEAAVRRELAANGAAEEPGRIRVFHTTQAIEMGEAPAHAVRTKRDSSIVRGMEMLRHKEADAFLSAGSTGALLTGATLTVKRIRGIRRAALAPVLPAGEHGVMLIDCGANAECTPEYLLQFGYMGSF